MLPAITRLGIMEVVQEGVLALQIGVVLLVEEGRQTDPVLVLVSGGNFSYGKDGQSFQ